MHFYPPDINKNLFAKKFNLDLGKKVLVYYKLKIFCQEKDSDKIIQISLPTLNN
jgi:hypothetical protein